MDPHTQRAEAERWLGIAAKLLTARDFLGSKTFAIRAREADPNNAMSEQILAVVDTVLGGERRLSTATHQPDWYAVLQLPRLVRDPDLIATHYRRLVLLLNPEHNRFPFADYALQLVMEAWAVLSEPTKKWLFDNELAMSLQNQRSEPQPNPPIRVDPVRVDPDSVAPSGSSSGSTTPQLNTFQFFQPPQSQPQTLPMWQQQPQQQTQREFMSPPPPPPMSSGPPPPTQQAQQLLPQWQMRDPTPAKGGERNKGSANGTGGAKGATSSTSAVPPPAPPPVQAAHPPPSTPVTTTREAAPPHVGVAPTPSPTPARARAAASTIVNDGNATSTNTGNNNNHNNPTVESAPTPAPAPVSAVENNDGVVEEQVESFWTACPYCFYIYEYQKMYQDCTLRCQNCRRGFHAAQIPNPPPIGHNGGAKDKDKVASFCCWGFFPLGFSMTAWKKHNQFGNANGSSNWVPFSPMFTCPTENGDGNFHWFANAAGEKNVGRKGRVAGQKNVERQSGLGNNSAPRVYMDDEAYIELSDPSDSDSSDRDWRNPVKNKKKKGPTGRKRGRPRKVDNLDQENHQHWTRGGGASVGGEDLEDGSEAQQVVVGLAAGARTDTSKNMAASVSRKQTRRSVKDVGRLDLNVEFNNDGEEHASAVSAVNGEEDGMETIEFFEGLDEFLSTLPILNVGGDEKAKPS